MRMKHQRSPIPTKGTCSMRGTLHQGVLRYLKGEWLVPGLKFSRPMVVGRRSKLPRERIRVLKPLKAPWRISVQQQTANSFSLPMLLWSWSSISHEHVVVSSIQGRIAASSEAFRLYPRDCRQRLVFHSDKTPLCVTFLTSMTSPGRRIKVNRKSHQPKFPMHD